jgi:hypothetical protein
VTAIDRSDDSARSERRFRLTLPATGALLEQPFSQDTRAVRNALIAGRPTDGA